MVPRHIEAKALQHVAHGLNERGGPQQKTLALQIVRCHQARHHLVQTPAETGPDGKGFDVFDREAQLQAAAFSPAQKLGQSMTLDYVGLRSRRSRTMPGLHRAVPSMSVLATFEAAARLGRFTAAAAELGVTQAAVRSRFWRTA